MPFDKKTAVEIGKKAGKRSAELRYADKTLEDYRKIQINIHTTSGEAKMIKDGAAQKGLSVSSLIVRAVEKYIENGEGGE